MKYTRRVPVVLVMSCLCLVFITMPAYGYVDPNATGLISQILTPLLIAAAASATFLRKRLGSVLSAMSRRLRRKADDQQV